MSYANSLRKLQAYLSAIRTQIGAGLTAAIRPVIVALNQLMAKLLSAAKAFTTFMQTLFPFQNGASGLALTDAADSADDLADGADSAADGLADADDYAKKLKKDLSVLPFDELNQLNKDRESASTSKKSVGGTDAMPSLDTGGLLDWDGFMDSLNDSKLPDAISAWAKRIKDAFEKHDWEKLGYEIANGINKGIDWLYQKLDPNLVAKKINPWIDAFASTMNSLVRHINFEKLGEDFGRGMTIVFNAANRFMNQFNWKGLGEQLGRGANGLVNGIDWNSMGQFFANKINILWRTASGFVETFGWHGLGRSLATGANAFVNQIDFQSMVNTISNGLKGISSTLRSFALNFDWRGLGTKLAKYSNRLIGQVDLYDLGDSLGSNFTKMWNALGIWAKKFNWRGIGTMLASGINGLNDAISWSTVADTLAASLNGAFDALAAFAQNVKWDDLVNNITDGINKFIEEFDWVANGQKLNIFVTNILNALIKFVKDTDWKGLGEGIANMVEEQKWIELLPNAASAIMNALGDLLSGLGNTAAGKLVRGLVLGLTTVTLAGRFDNFISRIATVISGQEQKNVVGNAVSNLFTGAIAKLSPVLAPIAPAIGVIAAAVGTVGGAIVIADNLIKQDVPGIRDEIQAIADDCKESSGKLNALKEDVKTALGEAETNVEAKKRIAEPFIKILEDLSKKTGELTKAEQTQKTDAIEKLIEIYPELNGVITEQDTNLSNVVKTVKDYISQTEAVARSQVYFEAIKEEVEGQVKAEKDLKKAQEDREELQKRMNEYDKTKNDLAKALGDQLGINIQQYKNVDDALTDNAGSYVTWHNQTKPVGDFVKDLYDGYAQTQIELDKLDTTIGESTTAISNSEQRVQDYVNLMQNWKTETSGVTKEIGTLEEEAKKVPTNIRTGITHTQGMPSQIIDQMRGEMLNKLMGSTGNGGKNDWEDKGEHIPEGTAKGVNNKTSEAVKSVETMSDNMGGAFDKKNEIASPSKLYERKAEHIPEGVAQGVKAKQSDAVTSINNMADALSKAFDTKAVLLKSSLFEKSGQIISRIADGINGKKATVTTAVNGIGGEVGKLSTEISKKDTDVYNKSAEITSKVGTGISSKKSEVTTSVSGIVGEISTLLTNISAKNTDAYNAGNNVVGKIIDGMNGAKANFSASSFISDMLSGMNGYLEGLTREYGTAWTWGHNVIQQFVNGLNSVKVELPHIEWDQTYTRMWTGEKSYVDVPNYTVNWYKKGGLFTNPSIVGVGEAGNEAVLPLENRRTMGMIASEIINSSNGLGMDENTLANAVARGYVQAMMANQGNQQQPIFNIVVKTESDEVLARAVQRGNRSIDYRENPTPQFGY